MCSLKQLPQPLDCKNADSEVVTIAHAADKNWHDAHRNSRVHSWRNSDLAQWARRFSATGTPEISDSHLKPLLETL